MRHLEVAGEQNEDAARHDALPELGELGGIVVVAKLPLHILREELSDVVRPSAGFPRGQRIRAPTGDHLGQERETSPGLTFGGDSCAFLVGPPHRERNAASSRPHHPYP